MLFICGINWSALTFKRIMRALHTFFLTSGSSSLARVYRFYKNKRFFIDKYFCISNGGKSISFIHTSEAFYVNTKRDLLSL